MKKIILQVATFAGGIVLLHWTGILMFSLVTPVRIPQMTGSFVYSIFSLIICIIIAGSITAELDKNQYFDRFDN